MYKIVNFDKKKKKDGWDNFCIKGIYMHMYFLVFWKIDMDSVKKKKEKIIILLLKSFQKFK